jgi:predicted ATP-dependent protease
VRKAVENKQFSIWGVDHVDQAMELLFGIPAGERVGGVYPPGTANHLVDTRLSALHETTLELARASMAASTPSPKEPAPPQS